MCDVDLDCCYISDSFIEYLYSCLLFIAYLVPYAILSAVIMCSPDKQVNEVKTECVRRVKKKVKTRIAVNITNITPLRGNVCQWDHTVLPATLEANIPRLYPSRSWYSIYRPT